MTTLEQLLDNFRHAVIDMYERQDGYKDDAKAAQDAIVAHVEGAMGAARNFGGTQVIYTDAEWQHEWERIVGRWV